MVCLYRLQDLPSMAMPNMPDIFYGREEYVEGAVTSLINNPDGARLAILGPGGMGKTAISLAIAHDNRVVGRFRAHIYWIPCEQATSLDLLIALIAKSLGIKTRTNDPLKDIQTMLQRTQQPCILLFDNFETPLYIEGKQAEVENVLQIVASISQISILVTMRSQARPCATMKWTRPLLPPLLPLSLDAARQTFLDINSEASADVHLNELLDMLDYVPLAVVIMAMLSRWGETPRKLISRLKNERSALLHQGDDRLHSINRSVFISIASPPMVANPEALILLQLLSMLPGGAQTGRLSAIAPGLQNPDAALTTLKRVSLVYVTPDDIIRVLSPIRSYVLDHYTLENPHRQNLYECYYDLAKRSNCGWTPRFVQMKIEMANEEANMDTILLDALERGDLRSAIEASRDYTHFLRAHIPRTDIILKAISVAEKLNYLDLLADCMSIKATIEYQQDHYEDALRDITLTMHLYEQQQNQRGVAQCLTRLGQILRMHSRNDEAITHLQAAMTKFEAFGDTLGSAKCLRGLGNIFRMQCRNTEALEHLARAKSKFEEIGDASGSAQCLRSLGEILRMQDRYEEARMNLELAKVKFEGVGDVQGPAWCLRSIGEILIMQDSYEEAHAHLQNAKTRFKNVGSSVGVAWCLQGLGEVLLMQSHYIEANEHIHEAMSQFKEIGSALGKAWCLQSLGEILLAQARYDEASVCLQEAKVEFEDIGSSLGVAQCLQNLGEVHLMQGCYDDARQCLEDAKAKFIDAGSALGVAHCQRSLGDILRMELKHGEARLYLLEAKVQLEAIGSPSGVAQCMKSLGDILVVECPDDEEAWKMLLQAKTEFERIGHPLGVQQCLESLQRIPGFCASGL